MRAGRYLSQEQLRELCGRIYALERPVYTRRRLLEHFQIPRLERLSRDAATWLLAHWPDFLEGLEA